ncbi:MAG: ABC1 kinase family protein [Pseudanabaena sp.]|jgi:predicted unusual protein kinase regulating ubiquinone biosynthesis (AarF/ABC1/UbiB family)
MLSPYNVTISENRRQPIKAKVTINPQAREREVIAILLKHGWEYLHQMLTLGQSEHHYAPMPEILCSILIDLGPVYIKFGQLLSTRPDLLPATYIESLSHLQSNVPPVDWEAIAPVLQQNLPRPIEDIFDKIDPNAIAAGSIAQVHRATLKDGQQVALKIQRAGIEITVAEDMAVLKRIAVRLSGTEMGKRYNLVSLADEFTQSLHNELNFVQEASFTERLRENLAKGKWCNSKRITVPKVYRELTSAKILVLEWLNGTSLLKAELNGKNSLGNIESERHDLTRQLFRAFLQQYVVDGFFHADPHPGNLFYLQDGRAAILDCGMMGTLNPKLRESLVELLLAMLDFDAERCAQVTLQLANPLDSSKAINLRQIQTDYDNLLKKFYGLSLVDLKLGSALQDILQIAHNNNLRMPSSIGLLAKSITNLDGTGREFDNSVNIWDEMKPLMSDMFQQQLLGHNPMQAMLKTGLELKQLSLKAPRQVEFLLEQLSNETFRLNIHLQDLNALRTTIEDVSNRLTSGLIIGSLIIGAAFISTNQSSPQLLILSNGLFATASLLGLWLVFTILRTKR